MRFRFIRAERAHYPVAVLCRVFGVSQSGFYAWLKRPPSARARQTARLRLEIRALFKESKRRYGSPRIWHALYEQGWRIGTARVERLMRDMRLRARQPRRYVSTTQSEHTYVRAENVLDRNFTPAQLNQVWAGDITYLQTTAGPRYLAVILDLCSRRVIGAALSKRIDTDLTLAALTMALRSRPAPALHHSDQGSQYAAGRYQRMLVRHGIQSSMSRRGNCWDNAPVESFFSSLKTEIELSQPWSASKVETTVRNYIHWYNHRRKHSGIDYQKPAEFEAAAA